MKKKLFGLVIVCFVLVIVLALYRYRSKTIKHVGSETKNDVSLRLKWINQAQFAGFFVANNKGFYSENNLSVNIEPGGPNISPIQMVVSGADDFGIVGSDQIILARSKGIPVVAVGVIYRQTPISLVSLSEKNIKEPKDIVGKKVAVVYGNDEVFYRIFLKKQNIDKSKLTEVPQISDVSQLLTNQVDVKMVYEMNDPILLKIKGKDTNVIRLRDYGVDFYGDTLFTTEDMIKNHPDVVKKFVKASFKGWNYAINNFAEAVDETMKVNPNLNKEAQLGYLQTSIPIINEGGKLGFSDLDTWSNMQQELIDQKVLTESIDISKAFTNEFLE